MFLGTFIAAFAIKVFFLPNNLIDGGTVGLAMIAARAWGDQLLPLFLLAFNLPFIYLAYRHLGKSFVIQIIAAVLSFAFFLFIMPNIFATPFVGDYLEVVVIGGAILGVGLGIVIRGGACVDGSEIMGIIINRKQG
ncbi:MAG: YitT family protein, partial [Chlamydiales bacterium]|nr:YitT family protein [Chlamydiales bacterium]